MTLKVGETVSYLLGLGSTGGYVRLGTDADANEVIIVTPLRLPSYTTAERDALTPTVGDMIWNLTTTQTETYSGTAWEAGSGGGGSGLTYGQAFSMASLI